jgi:hypothetical protein
MRHELRYLWRWLSCSLKSRARLLKAHRAALREILELDRALTVAGEMMRDDMIFDTREIVRLNDVIDFLRRRSNEPSRN